MPKRPPKHDERGYIWCMGCQAYLSPYRFGTFAGDTPPARCRKHRSEANHARKIKSEYDITPAAYQMLFDFQGGLCAICRKPSKVRRLAVDHDHATGKVRGLLCRHCNYELLGWYQEDVRTLERAIDYLRCPPLVQIAMSIHEGNARGG